MVLPIQGAWIQFLVRECESHRVRCSFKKKKKRKNWWNLMSTGRYRKIKKIQAYFSHFKAAWLEKTWLPFFKKKRKLEEKFKTV